MSSWMPFLNLGLTADVAAAHRHEFSSNIRSRPSSPSYPSLFMKPPPQGLSTGGEMNSHSHWKRRTKTLYHFAEPPPSKANSHHFPHLLGPQNSLLVQLQRLHPSARPLPAYDVLRASAVGSKFRRRYPFMMKGPLGSHDLVIVTSEEYTEHEDSLGAESENLSSRELIALIRQVQKKGKDGDETNGTFVHIGSTAWEASQMSNGNYEFTSYYPDGSSSTARWVARLPNFRRRSHQSTNTGKGQKHSGFTEKRFQFSMIDSNTRRHPILATLTSRKLELYNQYTANNMHSDPPSPTASSPKGSVRDNGDLVQDTEPSGERILVDTQEHIKLLILVTGTWVAMREGLGGNLRRDDITTISTSLRQNISKTTLASPTIAPESPSKPEKKVSNRPASKVCRRHTLTHQATARSPDRGRSACLPARRALSTGSNYKRPHRILAKAFNSPSVSATSSRAGSPEPTVKFAPIDESVPVAAITPDEEGNQLQQNRCSLPLPDSAPSSPAGKQVRKRKDKHKSAPPQLTTRAAEVKEAKEEKKKWINRVPSKIFTLLKKAMA